MGYAVKLQGGSQNIPMNKFYDAQFAKSTRTMEIDLHKKYIIANSFLAANYHYGSIYFIDKGVLTQIWMNGGYDKASLSGTTLSLQSTHPSASSRFYVFEIG